MGDYFQGGGYVSSKGNSYGSRAEAYDARDTYDDGYAFTSDKTGSQIAGAASVAGGLGKAITSLMFGNRQMKMQKKMTGIQHQQTRDQYKGQMKDSSVSEMGSMREYSRGSQDARAQLAAQGLGSSSAMNQNDEDMKFNRDLKINAIQRQRALATGGMAAQEKIWDLQQKMEKAARTEALISAGIDTAVSMAGAVSDQRLKRNFGPVDAAEVLEKLDNLPLTTWTYEWEKDDVRHMGPMAQDFHKMFGLGQPIADRPASIAYVDLFGVMLASIKSLSAKVQTLERIVKLRK